MLLCQINPKNIIWDGAPQNDPRGVSLTLFKTLDWKFSFLNKPYNEPKFNNSSVYFFIDVCNYECKLACFIGNDVDFINDPEVAGISQWDIERYIIQNASLSLPGWYPISKYIQKKLKHYFKNNLDVNCSYTYIKHAEA